MTAPSEGKKCPKCGKQMTGEMDYDSLKAFLAKEITLKQARGSYVCTNPKCGHEEKVR